MRQRLAGAHGLHDLPDRCTGRLGVMLPIHERLVSCARDFPVDAVGFEPLRRTFRLGAMPRNAFSLGISLLGIARSYSRVLNE